MAAADQAEFGTAGGRHKASLLQYLDKMQAEF
jgi:hypothetical protein